MRTNIDIDEKLINEIIRLSKAKTKKEVVEKALQNYLQYLCKLDLLKLKGKIDWNGDLNEMRSV